MTKLKFIWDKEEDILKTQFGIGAKAKMGITLPEKPKPLIEGLPISKPEDKPEGVLSKIGKGLIGVFGTWEAKKRANPELQQVEDFGREVLTEANKWAEQLKGVDWKQSGSSIEQVAIIYERLTGESRDKALVEIKKQKDLNIFFANPPEKYKEAVNLQNQLTDIHIKGAEPGKDLIGQIGWVGMVAILGYQAVAGAISISPIILNKIKNKQIVKHISQNKAFKAILEVTKGTDTPAQRKLFDNILADAQAQGVNPGKIIKGGYAYTGVTPRFAFGTKLYAGLPADEIVKSLVKVGKVTADMVKGLDPVKVSQVTQQLLNINPALANEFLKAVEKPKPTKEEIYAKKYDIPLDRVKITKIPKVEEPETAEALKILQKAKIEPEKPLTAKEKFMAKIEEIRKAKIKGFAEKPIEKVEEIKKEIELATPIQIKKAHAIANSKAMISDKGKMKPQYRKIAEIFTGKKSIKKMTEEEAEIFIDQLNRLPEPKLKKGKLIPPKIPITTKLALKDFFKKEYKEPTPMKYLTPQTYYAEMLGVKPLVEPYEIGKQEFDLEFRESSKTADQIVNKLNKIAKIPASEKLKSKLKNIPTKAESNMAGLVNKYEEPPASLSQGEKDVFNWFRSLSRDLINRENKVRESVDLPSIKYRKAYFRHTADGMAKEMLEGKYPFPQGLKYWSEKMVGKKIFNPMEFQRKLSDDLVSLWSKDLRAVTRSMLWYGLKEIHLAQPAKFLSEQLSAISKDLPIYKNLPPAEQKAYDATTIIPASTKKWTIDYVNQVMKGQETELDASLNRIVTQTGLKGLFNKVLSPFGRTVGRKPITKTFQIAGRLTISGVMGWVPRQIIRNIFQQTQNLALYGVKATLKTFLPASVDKNLKGLLSDSLFLKSYTGFEELPANLMGKLEKVWLGPYGIVATWNAAQGMKAAYWSTLDLIKNPKFKKYGWADPNRTKDTPRDYLYPSEKEKLLKEMEYGSGATQYQYIPMGMPEVFRHKALVPLTRLQSWGMNYLTKFLREATYRFFKGETGYGAKLPWSHRVNCLKYLIIGGAILTALGYRRSFLLGVAPTYLSPAAQVALGFYNYVTAKYDWQRQRALKQIYYSWTAFIPGSLAWRDFMAVWNGEKDLKDLFFYKKIIEKKKIPPPLEIKIPKSGKLKFIEPKIKKSTKLKFTF